MGTWGAGNFQNDDAADHIAALVTSLEEQIARAVERPTRMEPDEPDSSIMIASVEILSVMASRLGIQLPAPEVIRSWKQAYLAVWDDTIDELAPDPEYREDRRNVLVKTFDRALRISRKQQGQPGGSPAPEGKKAAAKKKMVKKSARKTRTRRRKKVATGAPATAGDPPDFWRWTRVFPRCVEERAAFITARVKELTPPGKREDPVRRAVEEATRCCPEGLVIHDFGTLPIKDPRAAEFLLDVIRFVVNRPAGQQLQREDDMLEGACGALTRIENTVVARTVIGAIEDEGLISAARSRRRLERLDAALRATVENRRCHCGEHRHHPSYGNPRSEAHMSVSSSKKKTTPGNPGKYEVRHAVVCEECGVRWEVVEDQDWERVSWSWRRTAP